MVESGASLGNKLCELFGIDPRNVVSISVHAKADEVARIVLELVVPVKTEEELQTVFAHYDIVEKQ